MFLFAGFSLAAALVAVDVAPPGKLVDIGGRKLHINCTGAGSPTVVLESGASAFSIDWTFVQPKIATTNRVCSYDRAGYAWSDPGRPETAQNVAADLHALLSAAGERPRYVLVGASMGGVYVRWYQMQHPAEVAGIVYVDASSEDGLFLGVAGKAMPIWAVTVEQVRAMYPPGPVPKPPARPPQTGSPFNKLPPELLAAHAEFESRLMNSPIDRDRIVDMMEGQVTAFAALHERRTAVEHPLGNLPIVALTRGLESRASLQTSHVNLAAESTNSRHAVVPDSGHEIHLFRPEVVIQAIQDVVRAVNSPTHQIANSPIR
jgi:pimeloyl-ACP methyl ester carboxylesterase